MSQFVLVHGGGGGPWVWELLEPELERRGHRSLAVEMPVDQVGVGMSGYIDAVCDQMAAGLGGDPMVSRPGTLAELLHLMAQASAHSRS